MRVAKEVHSSKAFEWIHQDAGHGGDGCCIHFGACSLQLTVINCKYRQTNASIDIRSIWMARKVPQTPPLKESLGLLLSKSLQNLTNVRFSGGFLFFVPSFLHKFQIQFNFYRHTPVKLGRCRHDDTCAAIQEHFIASQVGFTCFAPIN